jgi:hypothetical protein
MRYDHSNMKLTIEKRTKRTETTKGFSQKYIFAIFFLSMPELLDIIMIFRNPTDRKKKNTFKSDFKTCARQVLRMTTNYYYLFGFLHYNFFV